MKKIEIFLLLLDFELLKLVLKFILLVVVFLVNKVDELKLIFVFNGVGLFGLIVFIV